MTGGSKGHHQPLCGASVGNSYDTALTCNECICNPDQWENGSSTRLWTGATQNNNYISTLFGVPNMALNRFCWEVELPVDRVRFSTPSNTNGDIGLSQVVNPDDAHENLRWFTFEVGSYTSVFKSDTGTGDEEQGGTFQGGGTHFYHKHTLYGRYPLDHAYAINENTMLACMGPSPAGVRSGMRPTYAGNPLQTVVGENENGETDAYQYTSYLTRVYFDIHSLEVRHPATVKYTKAYLFYESNDIFALSGEGAVLGTDIIETGNTAHYPITVYNWAQENRDYRMIMVAGGNLAMNAPSDHFKVFIDANSNGVLDAGETNEIEPNEVITLTANTDFDLIIAHTPNFGSSYETRQRYDTTFAQAGITLKEVNRMRMTTYSVRTWQGSAADVSNKETLLSQRVYPALDSEYAVYAEYNHDKPNNNRLVRNSPDYIRALEKLRAR